MNVKAPIEIPEGFVEFSMQMMMRAKELRAKGITPAIAATELDWRTNEAHGYIEAAAYALLAGVEPPTIEGQDNGKKSVQ